jgi:hypothetical protein
VKKNSRKTTPKGFHIGPRTARLVKEGLVKLREAGHWGRVVNMH